MAPISNRGEAQVKILVADDEESIANVYASNIFGAGIAQVDNTFELRR